MEVRTQHDPRVFRPAQGPQAASASGAADRDAVAAAGARSVQPRARRPARTVSRAGHRSRARDRLRRRRVDDRAGASDSRTPAFIGVEPFVNGMAKALAAIESDGLQNIRLHFDDAVDLIAWLPRCSLARIDLIHPDPWPKRRHWKRRFVQDEMVVRLARILRPRRRIPLRHRYRRLCRLDAAAPVAVGRFRVDGATRRRLAQALARLHRRPATTPRRRASTARRAS